jgi:hypothetical protein
VTRLLYAVSAAPGIFQKFKDNLLAGLQGVAVYFDYILITGNTQEEHDCRVKEVLKRLRRAGLCLQGSKCEFNLPKITYLGFVLDQAGIHPTKEKVDTIRKAPVPKNKQELQSFLGSVNYYNMFLKDKATTAEPLHRLMHDHQEWEWSESLPKQHLPK